MSDSRSHTFEDAERWARLTDKQRACLDLLIERQTSKQIARQLGIAKPTVDLRLTKARDILGTANRDETAIVYARLKQTYDRITCDPIDLPPPPTLMPSHFPDGGPADAMALNDSVLAADGPMEASPPFRDFWRHDHARTRRALIMAAMLVALVLLILSGLAISRSTCSARARPPCSRYLRIASGPCASRCSISCRSSRTRAGFSMWRFIPQPI